MNSQDFPVEVVFSFIFGVAFLIAGFKRFKDRRQIEDMPTSRIATAAQGLVEFQGFANAVAADYAKSIDQSPVACSFLEIQEYVSRGKSGSSWEERYRGYLVDRFLVTDETGSAWVLAKDCDLKIEPRIRKFSEFDDKTRLILQELSGSGPSLSSMLGSGVGSALLKSLFKEIRYDDWRVLEQNIEIGQPVYVLGQFKTRDLEKSVNVIQDYSGKLFEITPKGGVMSVSGNPFIVSNSHQKELLSKFDHGVKFMIAGSAAIAIAAYLLIKDGYLLRFFK